MVQSRVLEALAQGGSAALDVVTKSAPFTEASCQLNASGTSTAAAKEGVSEIDSSMKEVAHLKDEGGIVPDPNSNP